MSFSDDNTIARPLNLRQAPPPPAPTEGRDVDLDDPQVDPKTAEMALSIEYDDGSIEISLGGSLLPPKQPKTDHDANLAEHIDDGALATVADDLIRLIEDDDARQDERLKDIAKGIELLGLKLEEPRVEPGEEGMSNVRHPLILEAVMRFQANSRGEFLPADGPVKTREDGGNNAAEDDQANLLARDMNHYLTSTALEYYPDTDRMFFSLGFGGEAYKKVYYCPIRQRPVSETVDRKDIILAEGAVSVEVCKRVTHRVKMARSDIRRMQLAGAYRDIDIGSPSFSDIRITDEKLSETSGVAPKRILEDDNDRILYECYCELDLPGLEHKEGLKLPYRVTIEKDSRQILEIRRWWREGDEAFLRRPVFIEYVFVPAFDGLNIGLLHILGNGDRALTAAWRIALDNGMYANFPGGVMARSAGRQQSTNLRVAPGQAVQIDAENGDVSKAFMPLPYRDVTPGFMSTVQMVEQTMQRVGGTAETETGEGRQDTPVGTTIALIEQATKVLNAVHKRMHAAQGREFELLKELFAEDPESLWRQNDKPNLPQDAQTVIQALQNARIVPAADPNTSSQALRIQKALLLQQRSDARPDIYDAMAVERRVLREIGISDAEDLFRKTPLPQQGPQQDPAKMISAQASMLSAQAKMADSKAKSMTADRDSQTKAQDTQVKAFNSQMEAQNKAADRDTQLKIEQLRLQKEQVIHGDTQAQDYAMHQDQIGLEHAKMFHEAQQNQLAAAGEQSAAMSQRDHDLAMAQADRDHQGEQADADRELQVQQAKEQAKTAKAAAAARPKPKV